MTRGQNVGLTLLSIDGARNDKDFGSAYSVTSSRRIECGFF